MKTLYEVFTGEPPPESDRCEDCGDPYCDYYDQLDAILCGKCAHYRQHPEQYWDGYPDILPANNKEESDE